VNVEIEDETAREDDGFVCSWRCHTDFSSFLGRGRDTFTRRPMNEVIVAPIVCYSLVGSKCLRTGFGVHAASRRVEDFSQMKLRITLWDWDLG
jgi:hypothetical protein